jgi:hypothetical protein
LRLRVKVSNALENAYAAGADVFRIG